MREFLHVDDLAAGVIFCMNNYDEYEHINCGAGSEISIGDLARLVGETVGFCGRLKFDTTKPDGTPRKLMDSSRLLAHGWTPGIPLKEGIASTYQWFLENKSNLSVAA
jgi:GDP-L-fucose synthase